MKKRSSSTMPKPHEIRLHWAAFLVEMGKFDSSDEVLEADYCFACGFLPTTGKCERAHILAVCEGGRDSVDNIHLLCPTCHKGSETISGDAYFEWLRRRNIFDVLLAKAAARGVNFSALFCSAPQEAQARFLEQDTLIKHALTKAERAP